MSKRLYYCLSYISFSFDLGDSQQTHNLQAGTNMQLLSPINSPLGNSPVHLPVAPSSSLSLFSTYSKFKSNCLIIQNIYPYFVLNDRKLQKRCFYISLLGNQSPLTSSSRHRQLSQRGARESFLYRSDSEYSNNGSRRSSFADRASINSEDTW